jgi:hypothetical protein
LGWLTEQALKGVDESEIVKKVTLTYDLITLDLSFTNATSPSSPYFRATFEINQHTATLKTLYSPNSDLESKIKNLILSKSPNQGYGWDTGINTSHYNPETERYVTIADEIAKQGYRCSSGDDFRPGYFSEISVTGDAIILKQINHYNSRSINHKDDYHMRDLEFYIPLKRIDHEKKSPNLRSNSYQIGDMAIVFSDRSSEKNKACGNEVLNKIREEALVFKQ